MKRRDELYIGGCNRFCKTALTGEMRKRRNGNDGDLRSQEPDWLLLKQNRSDRSVVAVVQPHPGRGGFAYVGVVEVVRQFQAVAPATDNQGKRQDGENPGLKKLKYCRFEAVETGTF